VRMYCAVITPVIEDLGYELVRIRLMGGKTHLLQIMARLRDPEKGCPWDIKQTFQSIVPSTLEEAYEVADAIEREDYGHLKEELGDLLFQVIFYSQLGKEEALFTFQDIVAGLAEKLVRRHPHVFPGGTLDGSVAMDAISEDEVKANWEAIKQQERQEHGHNGLLDDVPLALPALKRSAKLQKRAATVGFDWDNAREVIDKVREETQELEAAIQQQEQAAVADEIGDLLFSVINLSRHLKVDAESALRSANRKFERRFTYIEQQLAAREATVFESSREQMEALWQEAKEKETP